MLMIFTNNAKSYILTCLNICRNILKLVIFISTGESGRSCVVQSPGRKLCVTAAPPLSAPHVRAAAGSRKLQLCDLLKNVI